MQVGCVVCVLLMTYYCRGGADGGGVGSSESGGVRWLEAMQSLL